MTDSRSELHAIKTELLVAIAESKSQLSNQIAAESRAIREEISGLRSGLQIISEALLHPDEQKRVRKATATG